MNLQEIKEYVSFTLIELEKLEDNSYKSGYEDALKAIQKKINEMEEKER